MISIAKFAALTPTPSTSCAQPATTASTSMASGSFLRSVITTHSARTAGTTTAMECVRPASWLAASVARANTKRTTAQKPSTPVGCLRKKS